MDTNRYTTKSFAQRPNGCVPEAKLDRNSGIFLHFFLFLKWMTAEENAWGSTKSLKALHTNRRLANWKPFKLPS